MRKLRCICCGMPISNAAREDVHMCMDCEYDIRSGAKFDGYVHLDA